MLPHTIQIQIEFVSSKRVASEVSICVLSNLYVCRRLWHISLGAKIWNLVVGGIAEVTKTERVNRAIITPEHDGIKAINPITE